MLVIRRDQMEAFEREGLERFARELAPGVSLSFPDLCSSLPADELVRTMMRAFERARIYGISTESDLSRYANIAVVFGPDLDRDPALPWAARILKSDEPAEIRVEKLFQEALTKVATARGPRARVVSLSASQ